MEGFSQVGLKHHLNNDEVVEMLVKVKKAKNLSQVRYYVIKKRVS